MKDHWPTMFELEEWTVNKQADQLTKKLFSTSGKRKRKHEETETKNVKTQKLGTVSRQKQSEIHQKRNLAENENDQNRRKKMRVGNESHKQSWECKQKRLEEKSEKSNSRTKEPKLDKPSKANTLLLSKSPRNKYKHLAVKKETSSKTNHEKNIHLEDNTNRNDSSGTLVNSKKKKENISEYECSEKATDKILKVISKSGKSVKSKKDRKGTDPNQSSDSQSKPQTGKTEKRDLEKKRKRKKKNNPKKNKYRHLVLAKLASNSSKVEVNSPSLSVNTTDGEKSSPGDSKLSVRLTKEETHRKQSKASKKHSLDHEILKGKLRGHNSARTSNNSSSSTHKRQHQPKLARKETEQVESDVITCKSDQEDALISSSKKSKRNVEKMSLKEKMTVQLKGARFRYLNEQLYTQTGEEAYKLLHGDKEAFSVYHEGFQNQVEKWPSSPLDIIIKYIKTRLSSLIVADFGCGDAKLAQTVPNKVHSFDLVALNDHVTPCNMSKVPLSAESVDICVFCLSLMGTNLSDYLCEANRVLKLGGILKIAEVVSRINSVSTFIENLEKHGFKNLHKDTTNKMFIMLDFKKVARPKKTLPELSLDPCVYKRR